MRFTQDGVIFSLNGKPLKLVDQYIHLGNNISSNKSDVKELTKKRMFIDRLSTIWKSDLLNNIKRD